MQVTGAGVIAEPGPGRHHILGRSGRKVADIGPAAGEIEEIGITVATTVCCSMISDSQT